MRNVKVNILVFVAAVVFAIIVIIIVAYANRWITNNSCS